MRLRAEARDHLLMQWLWDFVKYTTYVLTCVELLFLDNADMCQASVCSWIGRKLIPVICHISPS